MSVFRRFLPVTFLAPILLGDTALGAVVVDNDVGPPAYVEIGTWSTGGSTGYNGGTYRWSSPGGTETATWTANLAAAGDYEIFVWYVSSGNRTTSTKYDIVAAGQTHTVYVDQTTGGFAWESLGTYPFNAGDNMIVLDAGGSSGGSAVIADAVRFGDDAACPVTPPVATEVAPGVWHAAWSLPAPQVLQVLEFDLADRRYTVQMGFARGKRNYASKEATSQLAARYETGGDDVIGAINGSHFDAGLFIHGMQGTGGNFVGFPTLTWPKEAYVLQESGQPFVVSNTPGADPTIRFADGTERRADVLNYPCTTNTLAVYTPDWDATTGSTVEGVEVIVGNVSYPWRPNKWIQGVITDVRTGSDSLNNPIPPDGLVLAACPGAEADLLAHTTVGDPISGYVELSPLDLINALVICGGASGWLVKDGAPYPAGWNYSHAPVRHPRTVLAWHGTRHWFVTCDGRQTGYSVGMTYAELAAFLVDCLQVDQAVNLDGGGSTTMVVNGSVVNCPSDGATTPCTGSERAVPNALLLIERDATTGSPLVDPFAGDGRALAWDDKFSFNPVVPLAGPAPDGDGFVLQVRNDGGEYETAAVGAVGDTNCNVEAWVFCEYRPEVAADGFERVGIFARDRGNANFEAGNLGGGNCYALTSDTDTGRIRAGAVTAGVFTDFLEASPLYAPTTAWRRFQIECTGSSIRYCVDDTVVAGVNDTTHTSGRCGIGHHEYFATDANVRGTYAENFNAYFVDFDYDGDGDVDAFDFQVFAFCLQGPNADYSPNHFCAGEFGDGDLDVDLGDFSAFQRHFTGP
ncbi:MAG: hypothetical protein GY778_05635 [bacterium]|nr:hypothetical protein [bacterium]